MSAPARAGAWMLCPVCRVFLDRLAVDLTAAARAIDIRCPWCQHVSSVQAYTDAGARDLCECGCPRAAHVAYTTSDGLPPGSGPGQRTLTRSAPCLGCGCVRVSGVREVRLA